MTYARKNSMSKSMLFVGALLVVLGVLDSSVPHASAFHPQPAQPSTGGCVQIQRMHSPSNRLCANDRNTQHTRESNLLPASSLSTRCRTSHVGGSRLATSSASSDDNAEMDGSKGDSSEKSDGSTTTATNAYCLGSRWLCHLRHHRPRRPDLR